MRTFGPSAAGPARPSGTGSRAAAGSAGEPARRNRVAERELQGDLDQVDAGRVAGEIGHLPARDASRHLDELTPPRRRRSPAGRRSHCSGPSHGRHGRRRARPRAGCPRQRRGIDVDPADAESDSGGRRRSDSVSSSTFPSRAITRPLISIPSGSPPGSPPPSQIPPASRVALQVARRTPDHHAALAARVRRLEHGGQPRVAPPRGAASSVSTRPKAAAATRPPRVAAA